jgi:hypothetical protein
MLLHLLYLTPRAEEDRSYPFVPETRWITGTLALESGTAKTAAGVWGVVTYHRHDPSMARASGPLRVAVLEPLSVLERAVGPSVHGPSTGCAPHRASVARN